METQEETNQTNWFFTLIIIALVGLAIWFFFFKETGPDRIKGWTLDVYGAPTYTYTSAKTTHGYESLDGCIRVGNDRVARSGDPKEWFQCSEGCWQPVGTNDYVCKRVCDQTGDCRE